MKTSLGTDILRVQYVECVSEIYLILNIKLLDRQFTRGRILTKHNLLWNLSKKIKLGILSLLLKGTVVLRGGGLKRLESEFDHSPPSSAKAKNDCSYVSTPSTNLHGVNRDNSLFTYSRNNERQISEYNSNRAYKIQCRRHNKLLYIHGGCKFERCS